MNQIKLEGAYNFRDFGGYRTVKNTFVKKGILYRSDELSKLSENDEKYLKKLNLQTIIDFRAKRERKNNEDKLVAKKILHLDPKADVAALASSDSKILKDPKSITSDAAYNLMMMQNKEFVTAKSSVEVYGTVLRLLLDIENCPIVIHCRGGKDRTGYAVALILGILGVDRQTIMDDYLYTNICKQEKNRKSLEEAYEKTENEDFVLALKYLKEAHEEFLNQAIDKIENLGGYRAYAMSVLGLTEQEINKLIELYTEKRNNNDF